MRRQLGQDAGIPELFNLLELRFAGKPSLTAAEHTLFGVHFNSIFGLNSGWATENISKLFPIADTQQWAAAFGAYVHFNRPHESLFELMLPQLRYAIANLRLWKDEAEDRADPVAHLGHHVFAYYIWGQDPAPGEGTLLDDFYKSTGPKEWGELFDHAGRLLQNTDPGEARQEILQRCTEFFERRLAVRNANELTNFGFWLEAECLDLRWRLGALSRTLDATKGLTPAAYSIVEKLNDFLNKEEDLVVECFAKLTEAVANEEHFYVPPNSAKAILLKGLGSGNESTVRAAKRAQESLLRAGLSEYLDLETTDD